MYRTSSMNNSLFSPATKKKREPVPIFQTNNNPTPVMRHDVEAAFTLQQSKKYLRSSGLEK